MELEFFLGNFKQARILPSNFEAWIYSSELKARILSCNFKLDFYQSDFKLGFYQSIRRTKTNDEDERTEERRTDI